MAGKDKADSFDVTINLDVKKNGEDYFHGCNSYLNTDYGTLVLIEQLLIALTGTLGDAGVAKAEELGLSDTLDKLGFTSKGKKC